VCFRGRRLLRLCYCCIVVAQRFRLGACQYHFCRYCVVFELVTIFFSLFSMLSACTPQKFRQILTVYNKGYGEYDTSAVLFFSDAFECVFMDTLKDYTVGLSTTMLEPYRLFFRKAKDSFYLFCISLHVMILKVCDLIEGGFATCVPSSDLHCLNHAFSRSLLINTFTH